MLEDLLQVVVERQLVERGRDRESQMPPGAGCRDASARRAGQEPQAYEEGFGELLDGLALLADGDCERRRADGSPTEAAAQRVEHGPVEPVESELVDLVEGQGVSRHVVVDHSPGAYLGEV